MWRTVKLGDVCEIQPKKAQVKKRLAGTDAVSFMPMEDLGIDEMHPAANQTKTLANAYRSYTYFEDNDILLAKITPCFENGKLGIASNLTNGVGFGSSEYIVLRCGEEVLPQYIYYHLNQPSFRTEGKAKMSGAVGHKRLPIDFVANLVIPLPPLTEQQRIVAKLDAAFAEIDRAVNRIDVSIESSDSLFGACLRHVFGEFNYSESLTTLAEVTELIADCEHKTAPTQETGIALVRTPNIKKGVLELDSAKRISQETYEAWTRRAKPSAGDLILAREAPAGNVGVVPQGKKVCLGQRTVLIRANRGIINNKYLCYFLLHPDVQGSLLSMSTGATVQHVNLKDIRSLRVPKLPSIERQIETVRVLEDIFVHRNVLIDVSTKRRQLVEKLKSAILAQELTPPRSKAA